MLLVACQSEDTHPLSGDEALVRINTTVAASQTRVATSPYMGSDLSLSIISRDEAYTFNNVKWTATTDGTATTWASATSMLWKDATNAVELYAYAPHYAEAADIAAIPISIETNQATYGTASSDLLGFVNASFVPVKGTGGLDANGELPIVLQHRMSQLIIGLRMTAQWQGSSEAVSKVEILGAIASGTYNAKTMTATPTTGAVAQTISLHSGTATTATTTGSYQAILLPQTMQPGSLQVVVWLSGGKSYKYTLPSAQEFEPNKAYTMSLVVGKDVVELDGEIYVSDWESDENILPDGTFGETQPCFVYKGDRDNFLTNLGMMPAVNWMITLTGNNASVDNVKDALTALNGNARRIFLQMNNLKEYYTSNAIHN